MSDAFTVLWTKEHCHEIRKAGEEGKPLTVLFGGNHQSCPSLARAGIRRGDFVFPLLVREGILHIVAGTVVNEFISLDSYVVDHLLLDRAELEGLPEHRLKEVLQRVGIAGHRLPYGCGIEVLLVEYSTPIRFDVVVPPESLECFVFRPRKGPPMALRHVEDGKLKSSLSLQGNIRRLSEETAAMLSKLVGLATS
jgi:hypothetical protein